MVEVVCGEKCSERSDVEVEYTRLIRSTDKAALVEVDDREVWLPFSHIVEHDEASETLLVTKWLAGEKELDD